MSTPRQRYREQARREIKRVARARLAPGDDWTLSLTAVARHMGMTGPALYKYFAGRDDLLADTMGLDEVRPSRRSARGAGTEAGYSPRAGEP
ncbi:TetR family transcriptional regulator [Nonomuraea sp. NPDC004297]